MKKEIKYNVYERGVILALSSIVGILISVVAVFLAAALCLTLDLTDKMSSGISGVCLGIGSLSAGFLAAKKLKTRGVLNGALCGIIIYVIIIVLSVFLSKNGFTMNSFYHVLITVLSSACGGLLGIISGDTKKII